jgi:hypothetical protein
VSSGAPATFDGGGFAPAAHAGLDWVAPDVVETAVADPGAASCVLADEPDDDPHAATASAAAARSEHRRDGRTAASLPPGLSSGRHRARPADDLIGASPRTSSSET